MSREELREWWLEQDPAIVCRMLDGRMAILIIGPTDSQVNAGIWRFGFQVPGEEDIRWREAAARRAPGILTASPIISFSTERPKWTLMQCAWRDR